MTQDLLNAYLMVPMAFPDSIKKEAKERAHYTCVACRDSKKPFLDVHHLTPEAEGGDDTVENACPLCPDCHSYYGDNKQLRKGLRELRDHWWSLCAKKEKSESSFIILKRIDELQDELQKNAQNQKTTVEGKFTELKDLVVSLFQNKIEQVRSAGTLNEIKEATLNEIREVMSDPVRWVMPSRWRPPPLP